MVWCEGGDIGLTLDFPDLIDDGNSRALVIETNNWLHYLNYETIACRLSGCQWFLWRALYGHTIT